MSFSHRPDIMNRVLAGASIALLLAVLPQARVALALEANFWLSTVEDGPTVETLYVVPNSIHTIGIWGRPQAGNLLNAISLNLVAEQAGTLSFQEIVVHNPTIDEDLFRHQLVFESATGLNLQPNLIEGFLGLSFFEGNIELPSGTGIGPICDPEDLLFCSDQPGAPAWLFASVTFQVDASIGVTTDLYLEIGLQGVTHNHESPEDTQVVFGLADDTPHFWDTSAEAGENHMGLWDARVVVASADFDSDTDVDGIDYLIWQQGQEVGNMLSEGDANGDSLVNAADLNIWQTQLGMGTNSVAVIVEVTEPATCILLPAIFISGWLRRSRYLRAGLKIT